MSSTTTSSGQVCASRRSATSTPTEWSRRLRYPTPPTITRMLSAVVVDTTRAGVDLSGDDARVRVNVGGAWHTGAEAPDGAQDVDALELLGVVRLFEERSVEDGLLVRPGLLPAVGGRGVPCRRRDDLVVRDRSPVEDEVVGEVSTAGPPEPPP